MTANVGSEETNGKAAEDETQAPAPTSTDESSSTEAIPSTTAPHPWSTDAFDPSTPAFDPSIKVWTLGGLDRAAMQAFLSKPPGELTARDLIGFLKFSLELRLMLAPRSVDPLLHYAFLKVSALGAHLASIASHPDREGATYGAGHVLWKRSADVVAEVEDHEFADEVTRLLTVDAARSKVEDLADVVDTLVAAVVFRAALHFAGEKETPLQRKLRQVDTVKLRASLDRHVRLGTSTPSARPGLPPRCVAAKLKASEQEAREFARQLFVEAGMNKVDARNLMKGAVAKRKSRAKPPTERRKRVVPPRQPRG